MAEHRFVASDMPEVIANDRQEACEFHFVDRDGNILRLGMLRKLAARVVRQWNAQFKAMETRALINKGTTYQERRSWQYESARTLGSVEARAAIRGTEAEVLLVLDRASPFEITYRMTLREAAALAVQLQSASNQDH